MKGSNLTAVSLFSGCGGFDWGASQAGVEILWANDNDASAASAYKSIFKNVNFNDGNIGDYSQFPKADVLIGCYPCTGFSIAARRRNNQLEERNLFKIDGNFLYEEFIRALKIVNPKYLFVENVYGMLSAGNGWFFDQQLKGFQESGYKVCYKLLNGAEYGIPQARKRVFIVGIRKDIKDIKYTFPLPTHGPNSDKSYTVLKDVLKKEETWPKGEFYDGEFHGHFLTRNRKRGWNEVSYTIVAHGHHVPLHPMGQPMKKIGKDNWILQGDKNRRLSWKECAKIQGLPDNLKPKCNLLDKYKVVGNAVPPIFGQKLLEPIVAFENS